MSIRKSESDNQLTIIIDDRFDFSLHKQFRDVYEKFQCMGANAEFVIDMQNTSYMDSSALGMILLLKEHAEKMSGKVTIYKPSDSVNQILEIAQFHKLLPIQH